MLSVLASRSEPRDEDLDDLLSDGRVRREREDRWRLLVLEDAGEFLGVAAPSEVGRGPNAAEVGNPRTLGFS